MTKQFENPEATKVEDKTASDPTPEKKIDRVAEKAAEKAAKTVNTFDKDHAIFSK